MLDPHSSLIAEILKIPEAPEAIKAALDEEYVKLIADLRAATVTGESIRAALIEGRLEALDDVLGILERFAGKAKSHQE